MDEPIEPAESALVDAFDRRIAACLAAQFQILPTASRRLLDPFSGRSVLLNAERARRPAPGSGAHPYRSGRTPPTLSYVRAGTLDVLVETESQSLEFAREAGERGATPWEVIDALGGMTRSTSSGAGSPAPVPAAAVPAVFPSEPWLARTFLNLAPIVADSGVGANGFVVAVAPEHEDADMGVLLTGLDMVGGSGRSGATGAITGAGGGSRGAGTGPVGGRGRGRLLPPDVVEAVVLSWALLDRWAESRGLVSVPFVNGGKGPASGQSLQAFHAQFYALGADLGLPGYAYSGTTSGSTRCPVCDVIAEAALEIAKVGTVGVYAHPAPEKELTVVVAATDHVSSISAVPARDFARALTVAVRSFEASLGAVPPYNIAVRCGTSAGHLHAEVIPRSGVPVAAGFEKSTGLYVTTRDPLHVAAALRLWVPSATDAALRPPDPED
ncbi:MAG: hypothetical protein KKA32_05725 [Actinobacteria bacterium]|nr:hypothetical protein [Actinomycetota bacterium]